MLTKKLAFTALTALSIGSTAHAQLAKTCPSSDVCFQLNIPNATASTNTGEIFFQVTASNDYEWVGLGQGSGMKGANMFVLYQSADGTNVTVSPRLGVGHVQPDYDNATQLTLLAGSGINATSMVANVKCSNCESWSGGSMDFTASSTSWIYAYKSGTPIQSDDLDASIQQHNGHDVFNWDIAAAKGGASANPFTSDAATSTTTTSSSSSAQSSASSSGSSGNHARSKAILMAHAIMAPVAFVILFPLGAILVRLATFTGTHWVHAGIQIFALSIFAAAAGLGVWLGIHGKELNNAHPIIGLVLLGILLSQPLSGLLHHLFYKKRQTRTTSSFLHIYIGRAAVLLGIINGGLGLRLSANASKGQIIAYGVVAGLVGLTYIAVILFGEVKRSQTKGEHFDSHDQNPGHATGMLDRTSEGSGSGTSPGEK